MGNLISLSKLDNGYSMAVRIQQINLKLCQINKQLQDLIAAAQQPYDARIHGSVEAYHNHLISLRNKSPTV